MDLESLLRDQKNRTLYCGNLTPDVSEEILYELFLQAGELEDIVLKGSNNYRYGFVRYKQHESVDYALKLFEKVNLFGNQLRVERKTGSEFNNSFAMHSHRARNAGKTRRHSPHGRSRSGGGLVRRDFSHNRRAGVDLTQLPPRFRNRSTPRPTNYSQEFRTCRISKNSAEAGACSLGATSLPDFEPSLPASHPDEVWPALGSIAKITRRKARKLCLS